MEGGRVAFFPAMTPRLARRSVDSTNQQKINKISVNIRTNPDNSGTVHTYPLEASLLRAGITQVERYIYPRVGLRLSELQTALSATL